MLDFPIARGHDFLPRGVVLRVRGPGGKREAEFRHRGGAVAHGGVLPGFPREGDHALFAVRRWGDGGVPEPVCQALVEAVPCDGGGVLGVERLVCGAGVEDGPFGEIPC